MTLDRPITSEDVERKQLFKTADGFETPILKLISGNPDKWVYHDANGKSRVVDSSGRHDYHERGCDLISRIPPEPAMDSQVVDGCCPKHGSTWVTDGVCRLCRIHKETAMDSQDAFKAAADLEAKTPIAAGGPFSTLDYYDGTGCMEAVERMGIAKDFYRGQVVKYIWRLGRKDGNGLEDALKARDYLNRLITLLGTG